MNASPMQMMASGKYEDRIDSLSNSFEFNRLVNTPGLNFRVNKKKYTYLIRHFGWHSVILSKRI